MAALAVAWHVGLALLERSHYPRRARPPLTKLLLLAEVELLRTLRAELKRRIHFKQDPESDQKLFEVEGRLKELGENEQRADS